MAAEIDASAPRTLYVEKDYPCGHDPNQDGQVSLDDVVIAFQAIFRGHPADSLAGGQGSAPAADCLDLCI
jgi:hypothetical protein